MKMKNSNAAQLQKNQEASVQSFSFNEPRLDCQPNWPEFLKSVKRLSQSSSKCNDKLVLVYD